MPWKEASVMDERTKLIGRLLGGEKMAPLCREFGISRTTGHKIWYPRLTPETLILATSDWPASTTCSA